MTDRHDPAVLFVCVHNAGRSQISRVLTEHYAGGRVVRCSPAPSPATTSTPRSSRCSRSSASTSRASSPRSSPATPSPPATWSSPWAAATRAPTPRQEYVDWALADPAGQDEETVRGIIVDIDGRVQELLVELAPDIDLPASSASTSAPTDSGGRGHGSSAGRHRVPPVERRDAISAAANAARPASTRKASRVRAEQLGQHGARERRDRRGDEGRCA